MNRKKSVKEKNENPKSHLLGDKNYFVEFFAPAELDIENGRIRPVRDFFEEFKRLKANLL